MKVLKGMFVAVIVVTLVAGFVFAAEQASLEKGKALFNDPKLGTNGKTCSSCHPNGKGLQEAGARSNLADIVNGCLTTPLKGNALDSSSVEMQSLILYIKSFAAKKPASAKPSMGC